MTTSTPTQTTEACKDARNRINNILYTQNKYTILFSAGIKDVRTLSRKQAAYDYIAKIIGDNLDASGLYAGDDPAAYIRTRIINNHPWCVIPTAEEKEELIIPSRIKN